MTFTKSKFVLVLYLLLLLSAPFSFAQGKPKKALVFTQKDLNAYKIEENKYDFRSKDTFHYLSTKGDTTTYFIDPSTYKGILNYGVDFAARDKRLFTFIENYNVYYTDVIFEKFVFSPADSIAEIEGRIIGGWNSMDFKGSPPANLVEIAVGKLRKSTYEVNFHMEDYNTEKLLISYKGEEKKESFPLDTLHTLVFDPLDFKKTFPATAPFKIRIKVDKNTILTIGKLSCFVHFYNIGEMLLAQPRKKGVSTPKKAKDAPRFLRIIENNKQVNDPKNQIKKEIPPYYQLTEKAESYILTRQYAKAKETYGLLADSHPTLFARDIHNAIRVSILSRDVKKAFWWGEKLALKGVQLPYFKAKIFNAMRKNPEWKDFSILFDSVSKVARSNHNTKLIQQLNDLLNEDQADYGLENRKEPTVLYETTGRVTGKFIELLKKEGYPTEEKIGAFTRNDTILIQSPEFGVVIRHAIQQKPKNLPLLNELLEQSYSALEYDSKRSVNNRMFINSCFHIYKGNLYNSKNCDDSNAAMVRKMVFMFNNPYGFIMDNGDYIVSEYNKDNPKEWDDFYENNFNLVLKLTDDWEFYEK